jgi:hypothetical protein
MKAAAMAEQAANLQALHPGDWGDQNVRAFPFWQVRGHTGLSVSPLAAR